jgi:hypothetical protein
MAVSAATFDKIALSRMEICRMTKQSNAEWNVKRENDTHQKEQDDSQQINTSLNGLSIDFNAVVTHCFSNGHFYNVIRLSVGLLNVILIKAVLINVIVLNVILLNVVLINVMASIRNTNRSHQFITRGFIHMFSFVSYKRAPKNNVLFVSKARAYPRLLCAYINSRLLALLENTALCRKDLPQTNLAYLTNS